MKQPAIAYYDLVHLLHFRNLTSLCLRRCNNIVGESLPSLIDNCSSLTSLVLDGTSVTDDAVKAVHWERSRVTEVDLSWCRHLTQDGLTSMLPNCRYLRYLRLCCCGYVWALKSNTIHCPWDLGRSARKKKPGRILGEHWKIFFLMLMILAVLLCYIISSERKAGKIQAFGLFLKSPKTFRAYFGCHNCLYTFATPRC